MPTEDWLSSLPRSWRRYLRGIHLAPVKRGMSDASLYRLRHPVAGELYLKVCNRTNLADFRSEVQRTKWLAKRGVRVPNFLRFFDNGRLGAVLMTAVPGSHPEQVRQPVSKVVRDLARGLYALHSIPTADCPFDETLAIRLGRARKMITRGLIQREHFALRNRRFTPQAIYERLISRIPKDEDVVLVHGDARFDNVLIDGEGNVGFIDCGHAGRGDRYLDLEAAVADIQEHFGPEGTRSFAESYGKIRLDSAKMRFFSDLYELF